MSEQLTLAMEPGLTVRFRSLKECVAAGIYQRGVTAVAGKIDRQPSHLSEALSGSDRRKLDVDDLERYIEATGDTQPILYLVARYLRDPGAQRTDALEKLAQLAQLAQLLPGLLADAGVPTKPAKRRA